MTGTLANLALAVAAFVGSHFILSSLAVRQGLIGHLGKRGFLLLYTAAALASFTWMLYAYGAAPYTELWPDSIALRHVPLAVMPFASILVVAGLTTRSVTGVGGESMLEDPHPVRGMATITRHPFLWGVVLWGLAHIVANGDVANLLLFGGLTVLALGGMVHIDHKRREISGAAWGPVAMVSSVTPFVAAIQGRTRIDWAGIGLTRVLGGLALYVIILTAHEYAFGVAVIPW